MTDPLTEIGLRMHTDKASWHRYTPYYHELLKDFRNKKLFLLELGFGGDEWSDTGGASVRMWNEYSPSWDIVAVDMHKKDSVLVPEGATLYQGSQDDAGLLSEIIESHGCPTIIIDDASHMSSLTNESFKILWPYLLPGGWYIVEDIACSYLTVWGGNEQGGPGSSIWELGKYLVDCLMANSRFGLEHGILPETPYKDIDVIHFIPGAVAIRKQDKEQTSGTHSTE